METKKYDSELGKYVITSNITKENKEVITEIKYKDVDVPIDGILKDYIIDLNRKIIELDKSISYLTEERRNKINELEELKKQWNNFTSTIDIYYKKETKEHISYEDLVHKKALIQ